MKKDRISRYLSKDGNHQLYVVDTRGIMDEISSIRPLSPIAFEAMADIVSLALLRSNNLKGASQSLTFQLDTTTDLKKVIATANAKGEVKGYVQNPLAEEDLGACMLSCTAELGIRTPFHSSCFVSGNGLEERINSFFEQSDQTVLRFASLISQNEGPIRALLYHRLPSDSNAPSLFNKDKAKKALEGEGFEEIAKSFFDDVAYEKVSEESVYFHCNCSKQRFLGLFETLSTEELNDLIKEGHNAVSTCGWCGKTYEFSPSELSEIIAKRG